MPAPFDSSPVFVIGFMATGKTTVGRLLAERLGRRFVDLDERIALRAGQEVPEIFKAHGERGFREREASALAEVLGEPGVVVACGGGTPCFGDNLARMRAGGVVLALRASIDEVMKRALVPGAPVRPLLEGRAAAEQLFAERAAVYARADVIVDTDGRTAAAIADELAARAGLRLGEVALKLGERTYPIHTGPLAFAGPLARELLGARTTRVAVVTDENVARAGHARAVQAALAAAGLDVGEPIVVPAGEAHKTLAQAGAIAEACVAAGLDRRSALVAVGGGVVGDVAGFVAATLYRGIAVAQVPTTLLAMIDSAIGGKTGVDLPAGKNLLGAFWQPRFVLAAPEALATLPRRELVAAHGEIVKYALLSGAPALAELAVELSAEARAAQILRCAAHKARVVAEDELERGDARASLNLGHTVGHAIEAASLRTAAPLLHGEAVALGLQAAARVSARAGVGPATLEAEVAETNRRLGLPHDLAPWLGDEVMAYLSVDKKRAGKAVRFIALERPGCVRVVDLPPDNIARFLRSP